MATYERELELVNLIRADQQQLEEASLEPIQMKQLAEKMAQEKDELANIRRERKQGKK